MICKSVNDILLGRERACFASIAEYDEWLPSTLLFESSFKQFFNIPRFRGSWRYTHCVYYTACHTLFGIANAARSDQWLNEWAHRAHTYAAPPAKLPPTLHWNCVSQKSYYYQSSEWIRWYHSYKCVSYDLYTRKRGAQIGISSAWFKHDD